MSVERVIVELNGTPTGVTENCLLWGKTPTHSVNRSILSGHGSHVKLMATHRRKTQWGRAGFLPTQVKNGAFLKHTDDGGNC